MPRPVRIQHEHALYHVMNHGRGRCAIFHGEEYYQSFLKTLEEAHQRFDAVFHAYCLMGNHYHLLIETPRANLDRIMRHINGLYTQRYNRLRKTDGSLFKGRYRAVLVDKSAYLLRLSRYIHHQPTEIKGSPANNLSTYPWSSYLAYINEVESASWLEREQIYQLLGHQHKYVGYRAFVAAGVDDEIQHFYSKGNLAAILGDKKFRVSIIANRENIKVSGELSQALSIRPSSKLIIKAVANVFETTESSIINRKPGRQPANLPRKVAIYCCQQLGDMPLKAIASLFGFTHEGSVSPAVHYVQKVIASGELVREFNSIKALLDIVEPPINL